MPKRKKSTIAQEVEKAAKLLQRLVRLKASDDNGYCRCVTCDKIDHYKNMQGGHFMPRGRRAMERLAWRASPKFDREEVIQFARNLKEQIKEQEWRIGEIH